MPSEQLAEHLVGTMRRPLMPPAMIASAAVAETPR